MTTNRTIQVARTCFTQDGNRIENLYSNEIKHILQGSKIVIVKEVKYKKKRNQPLYGPRCLCLISEVGTGENYYGWYDKEGLS